MSNQFAMERRQILIAATWAAATFGLSLAVLLPLNLSASSPTTRLTAPTTQITPKLVLENVELSVHALSATTEPTANATSKIIRHYEVLAVNHGQSTAHIHYELAIANVAPTSPMSRVPAVPNTIYSKTGELTLSPGETKATDYAVDLTGRKGTIGWRLSSHDQAIYSDGSPLAPQSGGLFSSQNIAAPRTMAVQTPTPVTLSSRGTSGVVEPILAK